MSKQSDIFVKMHASYEKKFALSMLKEFRKVFRNIPFDEINESNAEVLIRSKLNPISIEKALETSYLSIGLQYGRLVENSIRNEEKAFKPKGLFSLKFRNLILSYLTTQGGELISTLTDTMVTEVVKVLRESVESTDTLSQAITKVKKVVNSPSFYRWQAMRIARTETTFAMNSAKLMAVSESGVIYNKVWAHSRAKQERPEHLALNNTEVGETEMFNVGGVAMEYPGDKRGGAKQCINCRCTFTYRPKRDNNGRLMFK